MRTEDREPEPILPDLWDHQKAAVEQIVSAFDRVSLVVSEGPPGAGKTVMAEAVRRAIAPNAESVYVCTSKILQDQVVNDDSFTHARLLKGRANYIPRTINAKKQREMRALSITCDDCTYRGTVREGQWVTLQECDWCDNYEACPYLNARDAAASAPLAVLNTAYWLAEANYVGRFSKRYFAIIDEADLLDRMVTEHGEIHISERLLDKLGIDPPPGKVTGNKTTKSWIAWIDAIFLPRLKRRIDVLQSSVKATDSATRPSVSARRELKRLSTLHDAIADVRTDLLRGERSGWVRMGNVDREVTFRPLWPHLLSEGVLWQHATKFLLMSGTIISPGELLSRLGWEKEYEFVSVPSSVPVENRPIRYLPVARMNRNSTDEDYAKMAHACRQIASARYPGSRVLIHTVSYQLAERIYKALADLDRPVLTYRRAAETTDAVDEYRASPNAVLVAPSLERGLDLPGDLCRAQIVAKVMFPSLGDAQVAARLHPSGGNGTQAQGQLWYSLEALRRIIQAAGRGVRGIDDFAETFILDASFYPGFYHQVEYSIPRWWKDAIDWHPSSELLALVGIIPTSASHPVVSS